MLDDTIRIADSYALGDPTQPATHEPTSNQHVNEGAGLSRRQDRQDFRHKRKEDRPDNRYGSYHVATVEQDQQAAGSSQRLRFNNTNQKKKPWDKNVGKKEWNNPKKQKTSSDWSF